MVLKMNRYETPEETMIESIIEISEIYDCKYQNISKKRNKLVKILASELFPEDVLKEILEK